MSYGSNINAVVDTQHGENDHLGGKEPSVRRARCCLRLVMCLIPVLMLVLLIQIVSVNVSSFHHVSKKNLLIPINSSFKLPVDSAKHSAIKFFANRSDFLSENVKFIVRSVDTGETSEFVFSNTGQCTVNSGTGDDTYIILRYWPFDMPDYDGSVSCEPDEANGNSYLAWTWFNPRGISIDDITNSFKCPSPSSSNAYSCADNYGLYVSDIYHRHGPHKEHHLLAFRFCPGIVNGVPEEATTVSYTFSFQESCQKLLYTNNDIYTFSQQGILSDTTWMVTIPLHAEIDSNVYITYSASADQTDVDQFIEIKYQMIQNVYLVGTSVRERVNSAFMVFCMIFMCTVMIFIIYYLKKYLF